MLYRNPILLAVLCVGLFLTTSLASVHAVCVPQASNDDTSVRINGLVVDRQKYSFTIQSFDRHVRVELPNSVPVLLRLNRPEIDFQQKEIRMPVSTSAANGDPANDETLTYSLGEQVYIATRFANETEKEKALADRIIKIREFELTKTAPVKDELVLSGILTESSLGGHFQIDASGALYVATLNKRKGLLGGFSILDLDPLETIAWVEGRMEGDRLIADRIRFDYLGMPDRHFDPNLPRVLSLGDQTSWCYHQPLVESLQGKVNVFHPPMWAGPSKQWERLHHYLGDLRQSENGKPNWDVIAFNFGVRDQNESKENYQHNLGDAIALLKKSKAKLVWVTATPVPEGLPKATDKPVGYVQGRMKLQNDWATQVLRRHPDVLVCDQWQLVKDGYSGDFKNWWGRNAMNFTYDESVPLGRYLAKYLMIGLAADEQELNPPSVHRLSSDTASR